MARPVFTRKGATYVGLVPLDEQEKAKRKRTVLTGVGLLGEKESTCECDDFFHLIPNCSVATNRCHQRYAFRPSIETLQHQAGTDCGRYSPSDI